MTYICIRAFTCSAQERENGHHRDQIRTCLVASHHFLGVPGAVWFTVIFAVEKALVFEKLVINSTMKLIIVILCTLSVHLVVGEVCPGGQQTCKAGMTCCELPSGREGCCPYENATCCRDKVHCCPHGFDCLSSQCKKRDDSRVTEQLTKLMVDNEEQNNVDANVTSVICPDYSQCEDGDTCCPIGGDHYGCCPMSGAVCCSDLRSCCPHGYSCVGQGGCERNNQIIERVQVKPKSVVCPGGRFKCPDYNTCCHMPSGHYGCCPIYHAVCCRDGRHCCPPGYSCDALGIKCNKN